MPFYHTAGNKSVVRSIELADRLCTFVPIKDARIYFALSGSEANDFLAKFTRFANAASGKPSKMKIISRVNSYHGATLAATSMTGIATAYALFGPPLPGFLHTDEPNFYTPYRANQGRISLLASPGILRPSSNARASDTIAAFITEPATGGVA
ncbi:MULTISPECIES: aminotransferase class III-fold pyridoxal phosphate-dependent enzyme [unclassified Bradyrhizobium]|uniref:aminotransferase class III-fold pyridoxal phosphate-dependent enzyme n=1 Tax=unclassified Bradyrhizobium TaxID=2631580 RepID=UPI002478AD95|nr:MULTISPECIES: aminotransferase class III-fold pyridoxal phosphate-dependent enzyme [unclassified Bradyrhizobium]WGS19210.1 aminotransferase class III-fold pyridoxal phosphate-dependent enzyme [Bradyrhizobium sp. ISRA463]WGS26047.1 aminotransferase class III-fold pyridoxal phosphate-dependent enzyme [Bradyrhizobium sp. ISRA464]